MHARGFCLSPWLGVVMLAFAAGPSQADDSDIAVQVEQRGRVVVVDVSMRVEASIEQAWSVMTDYDHMARFVSNLRESRVLTREGDTLTILQRGEATRGLLTFRFENVREIVLTPPREIHSRLISGDLETSEFTTRLAGQGSSLRITNHGEFIPKIWVPPVIGPSMIAAETRAQFGQLRSEILRRETERPVERGRQ
jgi:hypothetical protein